MKTKGEKNYKHWMVIIETCFGAIGGYLLASSISTIQALNWFEKTSRDELGPSVANRLAEYQSAAYRNGLFWAIASGAIMAILSWVFHYRLLPWRIKRIHEKSMVSSRKPKESSPDKIAEPH